MFRGCSSSHGNTIETQRISFARTDYTSELVRLFLLLWAVDMSGDNSIVEYPLFQTECGGAIPTSPLHPLKSYRVCLVSRPTIAGFIRRHHYSGAINGCIADYCFALYDPDGGMAGALFYGRMAMRNQYKRFSNIESEVTELRRLVCIDHTPPNAESYFISKTLLWLKRNTALKVVVSYADAEYGHVGTVYKASNFQYLGHQPGAKVIIYNGRQYHDKAIRTMYNGEPKPFAQELRLSITEGRATYKETKGKHTFVYHL